MWGVRLVCGRAWCGVMLVVVAPACSLLTHARHGCRGGGLEPFLFRTYKAIPATLGERRKRHREMQRVHRKALRDAALQWEAQAVALHIVGERHKAQLAHDWFPRWVRTAAPGDPRPHQPRKPSRSWYPQFRLEGMRRLPGQAADASQTGEVGGWPAELPRRHGRPSGDEQARARPSWRRRPFPAVQRWLRWRLERRQRQLLAAKDRLAASVRRALCDFEHGLAGTSDAEMWQAIEATSAAPSIFPRARLGALALADGGLVANNPTLVALREAAALWPGRRVGVVVSLGTGTSRPQSTSVAPAVRARRRPFRATFAATRLRARAHTRCSCSPASPARAPAGCTRLLGWRAKRAGTGVQVLRRAPRSTPPTAEAGANGKGGRPCLGSAMEDCPPFTRVPRHSVNPLRPLPLAKLRRWRRSPRVPPIFGLSRLRPACR